jgi:hypothetical protein
LLEAREYAHQFPQAILYHFWAARKVELDQQLGFDSFTPRQLCRESSAVLTIRVFWAASRYLMRLQTVDFKSAPGKTRTCDLLIRSQTLYPAELRAHILASISYSVRPFCATLF